MHWDSQFLPTLRELLSKFDRPAVCALVAEAAKKARNQNYFNDPSRYGPWSLVGDELPDDLLMVDLSPPSMSSLVYIESVIAEDPTVRVLDFGCGLSAFSHYAANLLDGAVADYDNFSQVQRDVVEHFRKQLNVAMPLSRPAAAEFAPTVLCAHGIWLDPDFYDISSVSTVLSDRLYNSGALKGEGPFHYNRNWAQEPERFGFRKVDQLPFLDVYRRD